MALQMTIRQIKTNVQEILENTDTFVDVLAAPQEGETLQFNGYPSAFHYYENTDPSVSTITQNRREIQYTVNIVMVRPGDEAESEFDAAYELIDSILQTFDASVNLKVGDQPRACDILRPVPGELARVQTNDGLGLMATIRLTCAADVNVGRT